MELYLPPRKISEFLSLNGDLLKRQYTFDSSTSEGKIIEHVERVSYEIMNYYNQRHLDLTENGKVINNIRGVALEVLINAKKHGISPFCHELIINKKGICQGFHDSGDFYKREDIKQKLENRIPLKEIKEEELEKPSGRGILYIYLMANSIEVDTNHGFLWTAHSR
ncbi:Uncharacterised protein [uncultured archaeon]|nr:Uncharacterised protein [uncultured archaeon]